MNDFTLKSGRLLLRPPHEEEWLLCRDFPCFPGWWGEETQPEGYGCLLMVCHDKPAGAAGIVPYLLSGRKLCGLYFALLPSFRGMGLAAEGAACCLEHAFHSLRAPLIIAPICAGDPSARRVAERLGMKIEGEHAGRLIYCLRAPSERGRLPGETPGAALL